MPVLTGDSSGLSTTHPAYPPSGEIVALVEGKSRPPAVGSARLCVPRAPRQPPQAPETRGASWATRVPRGSPAPSCRKRAPSHGGPTRKPGRTPATAGSRRSWCGVHLGSVVRMDDQSSIAGPHSPDWDDASRPSKTNCKQGAKERLDQRGKWWREKNRIVDQFIDEMGGRAARPISVREGTKLREECSAERHNGGYRSKSWSSVLREFLGWYNDYRHAHLVFRSPEGETVRSPMRNSHQPSYGNRYYARIKALERQMVAEYDDLHVAMLTLTGSNRNANGGWRCPADHLRDVVESWRPEDGSGVYHALRYALDGYEWEYALVVEKHKSGYGHVHVAIFVDGNVKEETFHSAIDAHLRECDIAHRDAHDYYHPDSSVRPISVRPVNTDRAPDEYVGAEDVDSLQDIGNLGSYIGEYIGAYGKELFDRDIGELIFRAACWATGTQIVRFSSGANALINRELGEKQTPQCGSEHRLKLKASNESDGPTERNEEKPTQTDKNWSIRGVGRVDRTGEVIFSIQNRCVSYREIDGSEHIDPPNIQPSYRPIRHAKKTMITDRKFQTGS